MIVMRPAILGLLLARAASAQGLPFGAPGVPADRSGPRVEVDVRFDAPVPRSLEVFRFERRTGQGAWRLAAHSRGDVDRTGQIAVTGAAGVETLVAFRRPDQRYLLDGPLRWPSSRAVHLVEVAWRRTLRGRFASRGAPLEWIDAGADRRASAWPACEWLSASDWECLGVPIASPGVVIGADGHGIEYALAPVSAGGAPATELSTGRAVWARLVDCLPPPSASKSGPVRVSAKRPYVPRSRPSAARIETEAEPKIDVHRLSNGLFWIAARAPDATGWLEISASGAATVRLGLEDLSGGTPALPIHVTLEPAVTLSGWVRSADGLAAEGTIVSLYRIEPDEDRARPPRRLAVGETRADAEGLFAFDALTREQYEVVAVHERLGRWSGAAEGDRADLEIRLRPPAMIVGRVLRDGRPVAGVPVVVMPDLPLFASGADITELRGGETRTGPDGRFTVAAAARGSGELRVGDETAGVRRVPLARAESLPPRLDIGTIELGGDAAVTLVLEAAEGCDLLLAGPIGRLGLATIRATRLGPAVFEVKPPEPGQYHVVAMCAGTERPVRPPIVEVATGHPNQTIRLTWPLADAPASPPERSPKRTPPLGRRKRSPTAAANSRPPPEALNRSAAA